MNTMDLLVEWIWKVCYNIKDYGAYSFILQKGDFYARNTA